MKDFDPIALIESGYAQQPDSDSWVDTMTNSVVQGVHGGPTLGCAFRLTHDGPENLHPGAGSPIPNRVALGFIRTTLGRYPDAVKPIVHNRLRQPGLVGSKEQTGFEPDCWFLRASGFVDAAMFVLNPTGVAPLVFMSLSRRHYQIEPGVRTMWRLLSAHLGSGYLLSGRPYSPEASDVECVLSPGGQVMHATGAAESAERRDQLRRAVVDMDRARTRRGRSDPESALQLWRGLFCGRWTVADCFDSDGRRFVLARHNTPETPTPRGLPLRQRQVLFYAAAGWSNKEIGYVLGISESAVAVHLGRALTAVGMPSRDEWLRVSLRLATGARW
jgi:DNA-binding CsgD family transcriptional regulator